MKQIVLFIATLFLMGGLQSCSQEEKKATMTVTEDASQAVINCIMTRTSVRSYQKDRSVENEKIEALLRAGMAAPSAVNKQPWHFVVVTEREVLDKLAAANPNAGMLRQAPLAIVPCGDMSKALEGDARAYWIQDVSAATENILLAAHGLGLGAVWTGTYPSAERVSAISEVLALPETVIPLCTIVIGYPEGEQTPKDKWNPENVSWQQYGQAAE